MTMISNTLVTKILKQFEAPLYIYDEDIIRLRARELKNAFKGWELTKFFYACKANSNPYIIKILKEEGYFLECVSPYEINLGLMSGFLPNQIIFTSSSITDKEMHFLHKNKILINIDSISFLKKYGKSYPGSKISIRISPNIKDGHNEKVQTGHINSKFGVLIEEIPELLKIVKQYNLRVVGIHEHIGSGLNSKSIIKSMNSMFELVKYFPYLKFIDLGSGFKIPYKENEKRININDIGKKIILLFNDFCKKNKKQLWMFFEPGRYLVAESGVLLCNVTTLKKRNKKLIACTNTGFNHLIRPAMYNSYHRIINLTNPNGKKMKYDIVGYLCESGDILAKNRLISEIRENDVLAILNTGAYGMSMSSCYNSRPKPAEVIIKGKEIKLIRRQQCFNDLINETLL